MVSDQKYDTKFDVLESCKLYKSKRREWTSPGRDAPRPVVSKNQHAVPQGVSMCMSYAIWCFQPIFAPLSRPKQLVSTAQLLDSRTSPYHPAVTILWRNPITCRLRETVPKCYAMLWIHELLWISCSWKDAQKIGKSRSGSWTSWVLPCETASSAPLHRSKHYGQTNPLPSDAPNLGMSVPKCSHRSMLYHRQYSSSHLASNNLRSILFNNSQQDYHQLTLSLSSAESRLLLQ